jgi:hypothetical protein
MCRIIPQINCPLCGGAHSIKDCPLLQLQRVVPEKELGKYFDDGWVFKVQLQSGDVIVEKDVDVEEITAKVMEQAAKQIADEIAQVDIEKITDKVMEQAAKQIGEAVAKEKQRLLKE